MNEPARNGAGSARDLLFPSPSPIARREVAARRLHSLLAWTRGLNAPVTSARRRDLGVWQTFGAGPGPSRESRRGRPLLYGLSSVWNEDDVIWATVRNLFAQGADRVFVIDDESSDASTDEARAAGATVVEDRSSGRFLEGERAARIRRFIEEGTDRCGGDVWWLVVDADEFPRGPSGTTVRELVTALPPWVDAVGSRVLDHVPGPGSSYEPRTHPASSMPLARWYWNPYCPAGHWKHPLFRVREPGELEPLRGRHTVAASDGRRIREAGPSLLTHHVPFRDEVRTKARLTGRFERYLPVRGELARVRLEHRLRVLPHLYAGRYERCENEFAGQRACGIEVRDWRRLVPDSESTLPFLGHPAGAPSARL